MDIEIEMQEVITVETIAQNLQLFVARLDKIHPTVSGNKLFKLHYFLEMAAAKNKKIITYGGAWSNHLLATAYAANTYGLQSIGIVRGEQPATESLTLQGCQHYGMQLQFESRDFYKEHSNIGTHHLIETTDSIIIPEGGFHSLGAKGARLIRDKMNLVPTHVCVAVGTATTLAGLLLAAKGEKVVAFPILKNMHDIYDRIAILTNNIPLQNLVVNNEEYHFGGYAKHSNKLFDFMNAFYLNHNIPLDFVYTAKMMYGVIDQLQKGFFPEGSKIICLHTGGLQGNRSLTPGKLIY